MRRIKRELPQRGELVPDRPGSSGMFPLRLKHVNLKTPGVYWDPESPLVNPGTGCTSTRGSAPDPESGNRDALDIFRVSRTKGISRIIPVIVDAISGLFLRTTTRCSRNLHDLRGLIPVTVRLAISTKRSPEGEPPFWILRTIFNGRIVRNSGCLLFRPMM